MGGDNVITSFWREGKKMSYGELTDAFGEMISKEVLAQLDSSNLEQFYVRSFESAYNAMKVYLEAKNYKVINCKQALITAHKVKLIQDPVIWEKAWQIKESILSNYESYEMNYKETLRDFIKESYYPALTELNKKMKA